MKKFRSIQFFNYLILTFGIGLCLLTVWIFTKDIPFPILLMTGASGAVALMLGFSLILDMHKYRDYLKEHH